MDYFSDFIASVIVWAITTAIAAFAVMLGVANLHDWWFVIPSIGYWDSVSVTAWFGLALVLYIRYANYTSND